MRRRRTYVTGVACGLAALAVVVVPALVWVEDVLGTIKSVDVPGRRFVLTPDASHQDVVVRVNEGTDLARGEESDHEDLPGLTTRGLPRRSRAGPQISTPRSGRGAVMVKFVVWSFAFVMVPPGREGNENKGESRCSRAR